MNRQADKFFNDIKGKRVAFCGIGASNLPLIKMFADRGVIVTACDKRTEEQLGENAQLARKCGAQLSLGENYLKDIHADIVFRTPGMRFYMDELNEMRRKGVVVTSEMEVFFKLCPCK